tara:strand:+ start:159 stop:1130 length:972 start_codon:yes stop_codon:yes gene_type:complete
MINKIFRKVLRILLKPFIRKKLFDYSNNKSLISISSNFLKYEEVSEYIINRLNSKKSLMISRFGYTELNTLFRYENIRKMNNLEKVYQWAQTLAYPFSENCRLNNIHKLSGFYPVSEESLYFFRKEMIHSMQEIDLLGSWVEGENQYHRYLSKADICDLPSLEPYFCSKPWSLALKNKKVLIVHPFSSIIENQYREKRQYIFENKDILPEFQLKTLKTPITYPGGEYKVKDWFQILDDLTYDALKIDFEVAIIGCGAYGMPLASRLKKAGKKSIHIGGSLQILFGIKGKRWDQIDIFRKMYNKSWVYPFTEKEYKNVEDGCYW